MKFYSEITKKFYPTIDECEAAEREAEKQKKEEKAKKDRLSAERKARANEITEALKKVYEDCNKYQNLVKDFVKDYGSYHYSITTDNYNDSPLGFSWIDLFSDDFFRQILIKEVCKLSN